MSNRFVFMLSAFLVIFFFIGGLLDILGHFISKMILVCGFLAIVIHMIIIKSKDEDNQEKNLP